MFWRLQARVLISQILAGSSFKDYYLQARSQSSVTGGGGGGGGGQKQ